MNELGREDGKDNKDTGMDRGVNGKNGNAVEKRDGWRREEVKESVGKIHSERKKC